MEVLIYLVPLALALGLLGLGGFLWALNSGQFDDLDGASWRAIMDDDLAPPEQAVFDRDSGTSSGEVDAGSPHTIRKQKSL
jgi:cbb3-type cytochrome oxidase maturation protein